MSEVKDIDRTIAATKFLVSQFSDEIAELGKRLELSENDRIRIGRMTELIRNVNTLIKKVKEDVNKHLGRIPVFASDSEQYILGATILYANDYKTFNAVASFLKPEHFYHEPHLEVWKAILSLNSRNEPFDTISVVNEVRRTGRLELIGGAFYIAGLTSSVGSVASVEFHARVIVEMAMKRELTRVGSMLIDVGYNFESDAFKLLDSAEEQITEVRGWIKK